MTIFAADGASTGAGGIVTTGANGVTPGFSFSPAAPAATQTVSFSALGAVSNQPVLTHLCEFGEGTTGAGANPTHV